MAGLTLTVDYYNNESKDFLLNIPVPAQTGFTTAARNVGSMRNSGIEVAINYRKANKDFSYGVNLNFTTINNELLSLTEGQTALTNFQLMKMAYSRLVAAVTGVSSAKQKSAAQWESFLVINLMAFSRHRRKLMT